VSRFLSIRIEDTNGHVLHVFDAESRKEVLEEIQRALRAGHAVRWEDGSREWWVLEERVDVTKKGSDQYQWDKSGNRVRADLVKYVQTKAGDVTKAIVSGRHFVSI
jgi:hypothetical protein